jgi:hypothetical protein
MHDTHHLGSTKQVITVDQFYCYAKVESYFHSGKKRKIQKQSSNYSFTIAEIPANKKNSHMELLCAKMIVDLELLLSLPGRERIPVLS